MPSTAPGSARPDQRRSRSFPIAIGLVLLGFGGAGQRPTLPAQAAGGMQLTVSLAEDTVSGHGDGIGTVALKLMAPDGSQRASASAEADGPGTEWSTHLTDGAGNSVPPRPQDRLVATLDSEQTELIVPRLGTRFDRAADIVAGTTAPNLPVEVQLGRQADLRTLNTTADSSGNWQTLFGPDGDVRGALPVTVTVRTAAGHAVSLPRQVPMVRASLHPGDITGIMAPFGLVTARLSTATGALLGEGFSVADHAGRFSTWLRDPAGRVVRPQADQTLTLTDGEDTQALTIGPLWGTWDLAANRLHGTGVPGSQIELTVWNPWFPGENEYPKTEVDYQGKWQSVPAVALHPASHFYVLDRLTEGDEFFYCQQVPMLHVSPGTPEVMVETLWEITAALTLLRNGAVVATAQGGGRWSSNVYLLLRDAAGELVNIRPGDTVQAALDDWQQTFVVPPLSAEVDAAIRQLTGLAPPGTTVALGDQLPFGTSTVAGADGRYGLDVSAFLDGAGVRSGQRFEAYYPETTGHHVRQAFRGPELDATLGATSVFGRAQPSAAFTVTRQIAGAGDPQVIVGRADPFGGVAVTMPAPPLRPDDVLQLTSGGSTASLRLPALTVALDVASGTVTGLSPAGELVELVPHSGFAGDHPEHLYTFADDAGAWSTNVWDRGRGGPAVAAESLTELEVVYRDGANVSRIVQPGPLRSGAPLLLPWVGR